MASQWLLDKRGLPGATGTPAPTQPVRTPTPTAVPTVAPTYQTSPKPVQTMSSPQPESLGVKLKRQATAGLGWVGDILQRSSYGVGTGIQRANEAIDPYRKPSTISKVGDVIPVDKLPLLPKGFVSGFQEGFSGKSKITPSEAIQSRLPEPTNPIEKNFIRPVAGFIEDVAMDPLTYVGAGTISKAGKTLKLPEISKAVGLPKLGTKIAPVVKAVTESKPVQATADFLGKFKYGYGLTPKTLERYELLQRELGKAGKFAAAVANPLKYGADGKELPRDIQKILGVAKDIMERSRRGETISAAEKSILSTAEPVLKKLFAEFEGLAREAIAAGADPAIFEHSLGAYGGKLMYSSKVKESPFSMGGKGIKVDISTFKKRLKLTPEAQKKLGKIVEPAYGAAQAAYSQKRNVEILKFFNDIKKENAVSQEAFKALDAATKAKYTLLPPDARFGTLAGQYVPKKLAEYINPLVNSGMSTAEKGLEAFNKVWKPMKVVMSPAQLGRNVISSQIQAYLRNPKSLLKIPQAIKEGATKGKFYKALEKTGEIGVGLPGQELGQFVPEEIAKLANTPGNILSRVWEMVKKPGSKIQGANETVAKLETFIAEMYDQADNLGIPINEALNNPKLVEAGRKAAEEAGFNYMKVSPTVSKLRRTYAPFITYPLKAGELTAKTAVKHPGRLANLPKLERGITKAVGGDVPVDETNIPGYLNQSVRIGNPDVKGSVPYVNTKYLYPWGNLTDVVSGEGQFNPFTNIGISPNPLFTLAGGLAYGKDIFGNDIRGKEGRYVAETLGPSFVRTGLRMRDALTKNQTSPIAMNPSEIAVKEAGVPYYKYNPAMGAKQAKSQKQAKIGELRREWKIYLQDYQGKKPQAELDAKKQEILRKIKKVQEEQ